MWSFAALWSEFKELLWEFHSVKSFRNGLLHDNVSQTDDCLTSCDVCLKGFSLELELIYIV